jgi:hyperosmotically inducible periplasmic protein
MKRILIAACTAATLALVGCAQNPNRETPREYIGDSALTARVKTALVKEPGVKSLEINVETFRGEVQLSGFVDSAEMAEKAVAAARRVEGVTAVRNDMRIKSPRS